ncbi:MAG: hypothetical protein JWR38_1656 [Mucilaginibacter sp.]|nr:hypothetical protein [Mucilaginibacter sp.]
MQKRLAGTAPEGARFDLYIYADSLLKKTYNNLSTDTVIKVSGNTRSVYKALIHKTGYADTSFYWRFDTVRVNYVKVFFLKASPIQLKDVIIKGERESYKRGDTLVIPVDKIKTQPHSSATDLMDKIPGVSVGTGGNVSVLGKKVDKIKVDGVEMFGGNAKATLENVRSDMLKDVEITNLTGESDGGVELNLRLKRDKKEGIYGDIYSQYGTNNRENFGIKFNHIKPSSFFTAFVNYNNQNQQVLSPNEYLQLVGYNNDASNTLGTQKLYYNTKLEDPIDNLNKIGELFPFLEKGVHKRLSGGLNLSKRYKRLNWDSYVLGSHDQSQINENSNTINSLGELSGQDLKNSTANGRNYNIIGQSSLKWTPNDKNILNAKLILQKINNKDNPSDQSTSSLYNHADTLVNDAVINSNQHITNKNNLIFLKGNWEHRYDKPAKKTTISAGLLINNTGYENNYDNLFFTNGITTVNNNQINQSNKNYNYFASVQHSIPLSRKFLIDFRINTVLNNSTLHRTGENILDNDLVQFSAPLSIRNFHIQNNQTAFQTFLFYKAKGLSIITGVGALNTNWNVHTTDTIYNKYNKLSLLPALYVNYVFDKSKVSLRYTKEQTTPAINNLTPVTDSSRIQQVYRGNPTLSTYLSNKYEINSDVFISGFGSVNLSLGYLKANQPVIDNFILTGGLFPIRTSDQYRNSNEITGTLSYFRFNPGKLLNPYFFIFYIWRKQYQLNQQIATPIELSTVSPQVGLKMNINKEHTLNLGVQSFINNTQSSASSNGAASRFNVDLKDDNKITDGLYYKFSTKWIFIYTNAAYSSIKPVTNFNLYQYLGKQKTWQINAGINNMFNVDEIKLINVGITQRTTSSYNYLSRYINVGITFYPEKWKKALTN